MVFDGILISLIVALFRGGSFRSFAGLRLKYGWVFPGLLVLQLAVFHFQSGYAWVAVISPYSFIGVYLVGLLFLWLNRDQPGFMVIAAGVLLNFIVIAANGGRMPVSLEAASILDPYFVEILKNGVLYGKHQALTEATHLGFLGDIIPLTKPYPRSQVISIGDVVMNIGIFFFIQQLLLPRHPKEEPTPAAGEVVSG
ncbi:DUF5317 domain-containing protein [Paenibacillus aurantius]|uniref:DUF5317 domain-containing protein n=1 Tax=Paenibacillus aurantius TaxID=2918900 RepID=A0AA96RGW0_9BACL|nr:DUF5317 domain-containing protein [Paenibacillus aurantius]WNQ12896.1 DUF5317 domain-containing protein [Paenibacillus aurantius]